MFNDITAQIEAEYSQLGKVTIERQFQNGLDKVANTFLVSTEDGKKFVAKGIHDTSSLQKLSTEYWALKIVMGKSPGAAPALLFPNHVPDKYVLIELLKGVNANEALLNGADSKTVYELIGKELAKLHTLKLDSFGTPDSPVEDWIKYVQFKMTERFEGACNFIPKELADKIQALIKNLIPSLELERNLPPVLIHRDPYPHNVMLSPGMDRATLIDFAMAMGGRPFFDFGKILIDDATRSPTITAAFFQGYGIDKETLDKHKHLIRLYVLLEVLGQVCYFNRINLPDKLETVISSLKKFVDGKDLTL